MTKDEAEKFIGKTVSITTDDRKGHVHRFEHLKFAWVNDAVMRLENSYVQFTLNSITSIEIED